MKRHVFSATRKLPLGVPDPALYICDECGQRVQALIHQDVPSKEQDEALLTLIENEKTQVRPFSFQCPSCGYWQNETQQALRAKLSASLEREKVLRESLEDLKMFAESARDHRGEQTLTHRQRYDRLASIAREALARAGGEKPKPPSGDPYDWPEDFSHENGNYQNRCTTCGASFMGHKRRPLCKRCGA